MGHQLALSMLPEDEVAFVAFLRRSAVIRIYRTFAPTEAGLIAEAGPFGKPNESTFYVHNTAFPWSAQLGRVAEDAPVVERRGFFYIANIGTAPVIEYQRHVHGPHSVGRIYWAEHFAAPDGLDYDVPRFARWYDDVVRWVRKNGRTLDDDPAQRIYLPAAYEVASRAAP